jgi:hypothetical protein
VQSGSSLSQLESQALGLETHDEPEVPPPASQKEDTSKDKSDGIGESSGHTKESQLFSLLSWFGVHLYYYQLLYNQREHMYIPIILIADGMVRTASKAEKARRT